LKNDEFAEFRNVGIIGAGTIGGSLAIKLKSLEYNVFADDTDEEILTLLKNVYGIKPLKDHVHEDVDMLILAVPMREEERLLGTIRFGGLIMDVASVKKPFMSIANRRGLRFVGGHPMAGSDRSGMKGWDPEMFVKRPFLLCKGEHALSGDSIKVEKVVKDIGGNPIWLKPEEHDRIVSRVSQATYFISLIAKNLGHSYERFAGPGYESTTRLSLQNVDMVLDMVFYNRENILEDLKKAKNTLNEIIMCIEGKQEEELLRSVVLE